ncbi:hypothetical protein PtA15_18A297 [Puccinia triticina]|uniref:Uncharacterized protein n=1 Tax=Puccinia triticina TaxID=208348 RepID=A0ABY7D6F6_9BASI|nr:uncharacterized protein PtA15_18A297 [Puccinia triticina]WAQ93239.1 hypothetical protein PtA15_18A297 [Puccinia triticina]WAR63220.1 hypothetical protein PtB15_18B302 [Puccinia triticina]
MSARSSTTCPSRQPSMRVYLLCPAAPNRTTLSDKSDKSSARHAHALVGSSSTSRGLSRKEDEADVQSERAVSLRARATPRESHPCVLPLLSLSLAEARNLFLSVLTLVPRGIDHFFVC